jgi:hypothetical protein
MSAYIMYMPIIFCTDIDETVDVYAAVPTHMYACKHTGICAYVQILFMDIYIT